MRLHWRRVGHVQLYRRTPLRGFDISTLPFYVRWVLGYQFIGGNIRFALIVLYRDSRSSSLRPFERIRHNKRHELAVVINLIVFKRGSGLTGTAALFKIVCGTVQLFRISMMQYQQNAWHLFSLGRIDADNSARANRAAYANSPRHIFKGVLHTILRSARDLQHAVDSR